MKRILKNLVRISFGIFLALVIIEVILHIYNPFKSRIVNGKIILPINKTYTFNNIELHGMDKKITHTKNNIGFRGENFTENDSRKKIFFIGGSTTECFYMNNGVDWPSQIVNKIDNKKYWINNAGLDGHSTFGHILLLQNHIYKYKPNYCVFLIGCNDIAIDQISSYDKSIYAEPKGILSYCELYQLFRQIKRKSITVKHNVGHFNIDLKTHKKTDTAGWQKTTINNKYLDSFSMRLEKIIRFCIDNNTTPIFVTQPCIFGNAIDPETGVYLGNLQYGNESGLHYLQKLNLYNETTKKVVKKYEKKAHLIDLAPEFPKSQKYMYDYVHFTIKGSEWMAQRIYKDLVKIIP